MAIELIEARPDKLPEIETDAEPEALFVALADAVAVLVAGKLLEKVGTAVAVAVPRTEREPLPVPVEVRLVIVVVLAEAELLLVFEPVVERVSEAVPVAEREMVTERVPLEVLVVDAVTEALTLWDLVATTLRELLCVQVSRLDDVGLCVSRAERVPDPLGDTERLLAPEAVVDLLAVSVPGPLGQDVPERLVVADVVNVGDEVPDLDIVTERLVVPEVVGDRDGFVLKEEVMLSRPDREEEAVVEAERVGRPFPEADEVEVAERVAVSVLVPEAVALEDLEARCEALAVVVPDLVLVTAPEREAVVVGLPLRDAVILLVAVDVPEGVFDGLPEAELVGDRVLVLEVLTEAVVVRVKRAETE